MLATERVPLAKMEGETHGTDADAGEYLQQAKETLDEASVEVTPEDETIEVAPEEE